MRKYARKMFRTHVQTYFNYVVLLIRQYARRPCKELKDKICAQTIENAINAQATFKNDYASSYSIYVFCQITNPTADIDVM